MTDPTIRRQSVTKDDYTAAPAQLLNYVFPTGIGLYSAGYTPLPAWWSVDRDFALRRTVHMESLWAGAIQKAITRIAALGWEVTDSADSAVRGKRYQALYLNALAGRTAGWVPFLQMHLRDFLLTDNGAFIEVIRATSAASARVLGLAHLDSARCTRTSDPERPVIYRDRTGAYHELRAHQVLCFADMPDPSETWNGVGMSAASRAYLSIANFAALRQYLYEKNSGDGATELTLIQGMASNDLLGQILGTADAAQKARGSVYYKGKILASVMGDTPLTEITLPLKSVPDGFNFAEELTFTQRIYALAIGLPEQAIAPLSGQGLGTGTQTMILDDAADGEGLAAWMQQWKHLQNEDILSTTTTFSWANRNDVRDKQARATLQTAQAGTVKTLVKDAGVLTAAQGLQWAVDQDLVDAAYLPEDTTPGGDLGDDEKPITEIGSAAADALPADPALSPTPVSGVPVTKDAIRAPDRETDFGHTGVMIALPIAAATAAQIAALPGVTEPADGLHITLAYLGDSTEAHLAQNLGRLLAAVEAWAAAGGALRGTLNGVGRFHATESDGADAIYLAPDLAGLPLLRHELTEALATAGFSWAQDHGYTPHVTIAYAKPDEPTPPIRLTPPIDLEFRTAVLAIGDDQYDLPLGPQATATKAAARARRAEATRLLTAELPAARRLAREGR